jgi:phosphoserine phosphatase RsbU/P
MKFWLVKLRHELYMKGLWPGSRLARGAWFVLGLAVLLLILQKVLPLVKASWLADSLAGWVSFLSLLAIIFFLLLGIRWIRQHMLWRLRNRLIVTYMFIGVIPVVLLVAMAFITIYLFAGQFASFVVTSEIDAHLRSMSSVNEALAGELAAEIQAGKPPKAESLAVLRTQRPEWGHREVCAWYQGKSLELCSSSASGVAFEVTPQAADKMRAIVRDGDKLYLRASTVLPVGTHPLYVISSEAVDQTMVDRIAQNLGELTLYSAGIERFNPAPGQVSSTAPVNSGAADTPEKKTQTLTTHRGADGKGMIIEQQSAPLKPSFTAGTVPAASTFLDREITFPAPLPVLDWKSGEREPAGALVRVQTRPSVLYERLFAALGKFAQAVEYVLIVVAIVLAIIELIALIVGTRLTRSITGAVAQLYNATTHINRGDFSHRIAVKSDDQLATLANSFNSMTSSLEGLIREQKEKQRLENELVIAQEVQAQLYPREITQLESLEVHGFCRPARTVSGDYYDFLAVNSEKMILAVGDVSGKGISAALLMATIHSAVRAYSLEGMPMLRESMAVGAATGTDLMLAATALNGVEASPGALLSLLNHQLYASTPTEKYATLFLAVYEGASRKLTYSNGGHLPPLILGEDGSVRRLEQGGTVVGLFDNLTFNESSVKLKPGEIFIAYSDGVTEPENDYGEFGEERLIELVQDNRHLPLVRITEIVTSAVDDWIGDNEQPDDVTLVLARAR